MNHFAGSFLVLGAALAAAGCSDASQEDAATVDVGLIPGFAATTVVDGLNNPCSIDFRSDGAFAVSTAGPGRDNGNGQVLLVQNGAARQYIGGFPTEYWKVGTEGAPDRFKLGPLAVLWLDNGGLAVSNGGLKDGEDHLLVFESGGEAGDGQASNPIAKTSEDPADNGEGNFVGFSAAPDGETLYVCGQGADAKSWLLEFDVATRALKPLASADENGISTNSPMATLPWTDGTVLVLYSGTGGEDDGLIVQWDPSKGTPVTQWQLPGIFDPVGMDRVPGSDAIAIVDNNWSLERVNPGRLFRVTLPAGQDAELELVANALYGPTACAFSPAGDLHVTLLGPEFDSDKGSVVAIRGFAAGERR